MQHRQLFRSTVFKALASIPFGKRSAGLSFSIGMPKKQNLVSGKQQGMLDMQQTRKNIQLSAQASFVKGTKSSRALLALTQLEHRKREAIWEPKVAGDIRRATNIEIGFETLLCCTVDLGGPCRQG